MINQALKFNRAPEGEIAGKPVFIAGQDFARLSEGLDAGLINKLKQFFKNLPRFYSFLFYVINPALFLGRKADYILSLLPPDAVVADIGSGARRLRPKIVNVDVHPWTEVDIIADAHDLPFADESIDGVILSWTLEHLRDPQKVVSELRRVLKRGGYIFLSTNFVYPYHTSPNDYYRWSREGLKELLKNFEEIEFKIAVGPTSAALAVFQEWAAIALSFGIKPIKDFFWAIFVILTFPAKMLDFLLIRYKTAESIAGGFYYIGRKK